ncbi:MAG: 4-demethylwyosine synthase TYW1 [Candidatus Hadarchaeales archaeon]
MNRQNIIALISDFGSRDYYVGAVKGRILSINPEARIVDLTHEVSKGNVLEGAFILLEASATFPAGTIFLAVVDPGVGTERKCLVMKTKNDFIFVAPDNGILTLAADRYGVEEVREIRNRRLMASEISKTFHGRDVMAPVAAWLSKGVQFEEVGPLTDFRRLEIPKPLLKGGTWEGTVLHVDSFGNLITNLRPEIEIGRTLLVEFSTKRLGLKFVGTFGEVQPGEPLAYIGSAGLLELAKNLGNFSRDMRVGSGDRFRMTPMPAPPEQVNAYLKQGYRIIGQNSAIKICQWTRSSLLGGEPCYKSKFYGIPSWRCIQLTPSLFNCTHRCLFCWRMVEATAEEKIQHDEPEIVVEEAIRHQRELLSGFKGNPKTVGERWKEAQQPSHAAISLAGEPLAYDRLSELIGEFRRRGFTTFVVSNGTLPERLERLSEEPTQFYLTLPAPEEETYRAVCRPLLPDGWERILRSLELMGSLRCKKVLRLTLVKGLNMKNPEDYGALILKASPDFVEVKAYMHVGFSRYRLTEVNMPSHQEISSFAQQLSRYTGYEITNESVSSRVVLLKR